MTQSPSWLVFDHEEFCDGQKAHRRTLALTFGDVPDQVPPNWKQSTIVLLMLYLIVMLELLLLNPLLESLGMAETTFIGNLLGVVALGWLLLPPANRAFDWWLRPMPNGSPGG